MDRLTNDNPQDNFSTTLNYVYGKGGWAQIRFVGDKENVPLTDYIKRLCIERGCTTMADLISPEEIDEILCDCAFDNGDCPVFLAYTFACQAVHMRSRCKLYEDILFDESGKERLSLEELEALIAAFKNSAVMGSPWLKREMVPKLDTEEGDT